MNTYQETLLWRKTLASSDDTYDSLRSQLRESYENARENASVVLNKIQEQFPKLTLHDISHVDSLWQTASVIIGRENYPITPLEGYVLGCSFLFHDAALCYEAYGGKDKLRLRKEWKDYFADEQNNSEKSAEDKELDTDFMTIRFLHGTFASEMVTKTFEQDNGTTFHIIKDADLRKHLGTLIGSIAASHHWNISDIKIKLDLQINAMAGYPANWRIEPRKLACIIRCADAAHIDSGRAPEYLFKVLAINGVSFDHWNAQNHLSQIDCNINNPHQAIITSTLHFKEDDFASWNVAYDAIHILDKEIKSSNKLLAEINSDLCFKITEIAGASSRETLSEYLHTEGWTPCSASIHIADVKSLIERLGGSHLYGERDQILVVLRELIQNARDAVKARTYVDEYFDHKDARINIEVEKEANNYWISVSDNGIGMNRDTITSSLLDFGTSFWASDLAKIQYPGLRSSSFRSVGKFGIGFYSVFMVASEVRVESRRYDSSHEDSIILKFPNGLSLTPIMAPIKGNTGYNTKVKFKINPAVFQWTGGYEIESLEGNSIDVPFSTVLSSVCAGLDVDVYYQQVGEARLKIHTDIASSNFDKRKWLRDISYADILEDEALDEFIEDNYSLLEPIMEGAQLVGLAALSTWNGRLDSFLNMNTMGGLTNRVHYRHGLDYIGYMDYIPTSANRNNSPTKVAKDETLIKWANHQLSLIQTKRSCTKETLLKVQYSLCHFHADPISIASALIYINGNRTILNIEELLNQMNIGYRLFVMVTRLKTWSEIIPFIKTNDIVFIPDVFDGVEVLEGLEGLDEFDGFLNLQMENEKPLRKNSFIGCLYRKADEMGLCLNRIGIPEYVNLNFGTDPAWMFTVEKRD